MSDRIFIPLVLPTTGEPAEAPADFEAVKERLRQIEAKAFRGLREPTAVAEEPVVDEAVLEEVGQDFEVTKQRIREIEARALRKLREARERRGE